MGICTPVIITLLSSYVGRGSCYAVVPQHRRKCERVQPCRAITETGQAVFNETEGPNGVSTKIAVESHYDLDDSFRVEMGRRQQNVENNDAIDRAQKAEVEINRLRFQLNESKAAVEDSAKQVMDAENRLRALKQEYTTKIEGDKSLLDQLSKENGSLLFRIKSLDDLLLSAQKKAQVEMDDMKSLVESQVLRSYQLSEELKLAEQSNTQLKQQYESETERLRREADKRVQNIRSVSGFEKMELRKTTWALESKLEAAKLDLIIARNEYQSLKDKATILEGQLNSLQVTSREMNTELKEQLEADRMFYAKSQLSTKQRMGKFVQMFLRRMKRRELKSSKALQDSVTEWRQKLEFTTEMLTEEKRLLSLAKDEEIRRNDFESRSKISALQSQMDQQIFELNERIAEVRADGLSTLENLRLKQDMDIAELVSKSDLEKKALICQVEEECARASLAVLEEEKRLLSLAQDEEIACNRLEYESKISALQSEKDKKILELNDRIREVKAEGLSSLQSLQVMHDKEMGEFITKTFLEKEAIRKEEEKVRAHAIQLTEMNMNKEFEKRLESTMNALRGQMDREKSDLLFDLTKHIMKERNQRTNLEEEMIKEQEKIIQYEKERSSIKSLLLLSWRLSKQRGLALISRR